MNKNAVNFFLLFSSLIVTLLLVEGMLLYREGIQQKKDFELISNANVNRFANRKASDVLSPTLIWTFNGSLISREVLQEDPVLGYFNTPEQEGYMIHVDGRPNLVVPKNFDFSVLKGLKYYSSKFRINKEGNRGGEMISPKPADVFRIVFIGDSVTFGYYVDEGETFVKVTESLLQCKKIKGRRVEIVNAGVSGLGSNETLAHLKKRVFAWEPDLVVWGFYLNDVTDKECDILFPVRDLGAWAFLDHFAIGRLVERAIFSTRLGAEFKIDRENPSNQKVEESWRVVALNFSEGKRLLDEKNIPVIVVCLPSGLQIGRLWTVFHYERKLVKICSALSIPFLDVLPALESGGSAETLYFRGDLIHPSAKGHRIIGKAVADFILKERRQFK
jgi:lysophospholipase L1-like esterase